MTTDKLKNLLDYLVDNVNYFNVWPIPEYDDDHKIASYGIRIEILGGHQVKLRNLLNWLNERDYSDYFEACREGKSYIVVWVNVRNDATRSIN